MSYGAAGKDQPPTRRHLTERMESGSDPTSPSGPVGGPGPGGGRRESDPVRSKILYGGAVGLVTVVLVAIGLAALFDVSFWAALGITALIGLGLAMLLAVLVG